MQAKSNQLMMYKHLSQLKQKLTKQSVLILCLSKSLSDEAYK